MEKMAYDELKEITDIKEITKITYKTYESDYELNYELDLKKTLELLKETEIGNLITGITFWGKDFRIDLCKEYDEWGSDYYFEKVFFKIEEEAKKIKPESLSLLWQDPKTGSWLPYKTKEYLEKEKADKIRREKADRNYAIYTLDSFIEKLKKYDRILESYEFEPFTVLDKYNCKYITLPDNLPLPYDSYTVTTDSFYQTLIKDGCKSLKRVNFVGLSGLLNGKKEVLLCYGPGSLKGFDEKWKNDKEIIEKSSKIKNLIQKLIKEKKFTKTLGISVEMLDRTETLDDLSDKIKNELIEYLENSPRKS